MRILIVGPGADKAKGGMGTVIKDIKCSTLLNKRFEINTFDSYIDGILPVRLAYTIYAFCRFLLVYKEYDLFHIHTASFGSVLRKVWYMKAIKRAGKKAIVHIHGAKFLAFYEQLNKRKKKRVQDYLQSADLVLALSEEWRKKFDTTFLLKNCRVLANGVDTKRFTPAIIGSSENAHSFASLGRLGQRKGTYDLLSAIEIAIKTIPDLKCFLAGDGEIKKVKRIIRKKNLENNVIITGWIGFEEKRVLLAKVSAIILPSYNEGLPMSILEGMATGKAVISTTVGAIPEVVGKENGILIEPGDIKGLAQAMIRLCKDQNLVKHMAVENVKKISNQFDLEKMHAKLAEYYMECFEQ